MHHPVARKAYAMRKLHTTSVQELNLGRRQSPFATYIGMETQTYRLDEKLIKNVRMYLCSQVPDTEMKTRNYEYLRNES
jgi:hypothetical protein